MVSQVRGLAQAVGLPYEVRTVNLRFPWKKLWTSAIPVRESVFTSMDWLDTPHPPQLVIACGRQALMAALLVKSRWKNDVFTVYTQNPKIATSRFDLVVAPEHDGLSGPNVFCTAGALHHVTSNTLKQAAQSTAARQLDRLRPRFAAVLLGGTNGCYQSTPDVFAPLVQSLKQAVQQHDIDLAILPSRRTPTAVAQMFRSEFAGQHFFWDGTTENPYLASLALCSHLVVTNDSVSMISEAATTEKPVYVYHLPEKRTSKRFRRFHADFAERGITRPFLGDLDQWSYDSPNPTQQVADLIRQKLSRRHDQNLRPAA